MPDPAVAIAYRSALEVISAAERNVAKAIVGEPRLLLAWRSISFRSTVFPTPRSPMIPMLKNRDLGPARRPPSIVASVASRPANQGGSAPKVGL